ncbi:oxygen-dependent choline dehydrogenase, FAD/NAD(P)-binding domain protein [Artemisia annua]|uniref:Oxygen-dependent choline dehydrogenase, FAD/NAD(P)-binding domain protein n=1 Tax=Artemisia annua TaxID=35608 RepID=A0A2U1KY41_ARTAN|nr:oxygen-dependent choline dehydrogenase, FAD/NAD(P)-binding domain protein [Artemisia annua]
MHEATKAPKISFFDYIVIGGGTAGIPLATTLSAKYSVLLLERGGSPYGNANITSQLNFGNNFADTSPDSPSQIFTTEGVINTRARVLGGGTYINAGFYSRGEAQFNKEARLMDENLVQESYKWTERVMVFEPVVQEWPSAVRAALLEAGVTPDNGFTYDHIIGTKVSGKSRPMAYGVVFEDSLGNKHRAYLKGGKKDEIILSAGALGSPQLLMLSGIGPRKQLDALKIKVVLEQPFIGQGMADNPLNAVFIPAPVAVNPSGVQIVGITWFGSYIEEAGGFSFIFTPSPNYQGFSPQKINGPLSMGELKIENRNPADTPSVTFNYFKEPEDLRKCVKGVATILKAIESKAFSNYKFANMTVQEILDINMRLPGNDLVRSNTSLSLEQYCKDTVRTMWHYHGGCHIDKVIDHEYKVFGVDGLRVIDGSTILNSPGTNPQASVLMLGRYMGVTILGQRIACDKSR